MLYSLRTLRAQKSARKLPIEKWGSAQHVFEAHRRCRRRRPKRLRWQPFDRQLNAAMQLNSHFLPLPIVTYGQSGSPVVQHLTTGSTVTQIFLAGEYPTDRG
jgi:hypothetical protein